MPTIRTYLAQLVILSAALTLALGANYLYAWTAAPANPPSNNVAPPINTSTTAQTKTGDLTVAGLQSDVLSVLENSSITGKLRIGASGAPVQLLDLRGTAGTDGIRFPDGTVQKTAAKDLVVGSGISSFINDVGTIKYNLSGYVLVPHDFGTDWSVIILSGFLNLSDDSTAGGFIYKKQNGDKIARIFVGSNFRSFEVTTWQSYDYNCVKQGSTDFVCVYLDTSGNLLFRIQDDRVMYHYIEFW